MQKMIRKTALLLSFSLMLTGNPSDLMAKTPQNTIENVSPTQVRRQQQTQKKVKNGRKVIEQALASIRTDGAKAARLLNKIKNQNDFEAGLREILNEYYSMKKSERRELKAFTRAVDDSAAVIINHYEEAARERENSANLDFKANEVVVSFVYGTSEEEIERIVKETAAGYELIDSGELHIAKELPEYKKKRLEKISDLKTDIVILAQINLEDTVKRA